MSKRVTAVSGVFGAAGVALLVATGCSSSGGGSKNTGQASAGNANTTVQVRNAGSSGKVLTDGNGRALYASDQEASGKLVCTTSDCTAIWTPLLVADGKPTGPSSITAMLGTIARADGRIQVTLDGRPLYTFTFDHSAGQVSGNGTKDSFNGTNFVWHVATPAGISGSSQAASSQAPAPSYSYPNGGGY
jgi:predicted lipoprotein with Yx(FWY)xxD motif